MNKHTAPRVLALSVSLALGVAATAEGDVVTNWNTVALNSIRANRTPPPVASRALAILHVSMYDAVNGIVRSHEPYFVTGKAPSSASLEAAATAAAHKVLVSLFPGDTEVFDELHEATLARVRNGPHKRRGVEWGESVADQILLWRASDNADALVAPPSGSGPCVWQPTPPGLAPYLLPQWGFVTPFAMPTNDVFRPPGPQRSTARRPAPLAASRASGLPPARLRSAGSMGGIHYRSANDDGLKAGLNIGVWVFMNTLQPKKPRHGR